MKKLESLLSEFAARVREAVRDEVLAALTGGSPRTAPAKKGRGSRREKGEKRSPQDLSTLTERLFVFVRKFPGERIEQLGKRMDEPTSELALPAKKLIAAKRIKTKGQRRATRYFAS